MCPISLNYRVSFLFGILNMVLYQGGNSNEKYLIWKI